LSLQVLNLHRSFLGDKNGPLLFSALATNVALRTLDVTRCRISDEALDELALALRGVCMLETIIMDGPPGQNLTEPLKPYGCTCRLTYFALVPLVLL
jgi:hypothetical protein